MSPGMSATMEHQRCTGAVPCMANSSVVAYVFSGSIIGQQQTREDGSSAMRAERRLCGPRRWDLRNRPEHRGSPARPRPVWAAKAEIANEGPVQNTEGHPPAGFWLGYRRGAAAKPSTRLVLMAAAHQRWGRQAASKPGRIEQHWHY